MKKGRVIKKKIEKGWKSNKKAGTQKGQKKERIKKLT
jgi:hypothetical protein